MTVPPTTKSEGADGATAESGGETDCDSVDPDTVDPDAVDPDAGPSRPSRTSRWLRIVSWGVLPALTLLVALLAGYLKWVDSSAQESDRARAESAAVARDGAVAMLSYQPATVEQDLTAARHRLTGSLADSYGSLINDVVIPGSRQRQIASTSTVPAAATISASSEHAVVLVFVDQTITVGGEPPTSTTSRVRVTMDKVGGRWLIAGFDPI